MEATRTHNRVAFRVLAAPLAVGYVTRSLIGQSSPGSLCAGTGLCVTVTVNVPFLPSICFVPACMCSEVKGDSEDWNLVLRTNAS
ncbi:hypothetical protein Q7C36_001335 [Tachysurus vachellii]|uniref:Uncharacterized protein n=1 Tax=Tachysurus vachellii TaxID=175792 RepID=A0AA88TBA0_TACVA|nr:hypothetical protein Q7C36_001335 [Tachysurus vachellii]